MNSSGVVIPAWGLVYVSVVNGIYNCFLPTIDSDPKIYVNQGIDQPPGQFITAKFSINEQTIAYDPADGVPQVDEVWGPKAGTFLAKKGFNGFVITGGGGGGYVNAVRVPGTGDGGCCDQIPSNSISAPCPPYYGSPAITVSSADCCYYDYALGGFVPINGDGVCADNAAFQANPVLYCTTTGYTCTSGSESLCNPVGGGGGGSGVVNGPGVASIPDCPALANVLLPTTITITFSGCTGSFAGLNGLSTNAVLVQEGWLIDFVTPNGQIAVNGYLVICCDATVPGLYFGGSISSTSPQSYANICSCTTYFTGCPNATGEPDADPSGAGWESISGTPVWTVGSLFESLELTGGICGSVDMNITDFIPPVSFDCISGISCTDPGTGLGQYPTYAMCAKNCGVSTPVTYSCEGSPAKCVDPGDGSGTDLATCLASCGTNTTNSFNCDNGFCVGVSGTGGQFATYALCLAGCSASILTSWICSLGVCTEVLGSSGFATQGLCNTACLILPPPPPPPVPGCGLTGANQPASGTALINNGSSLSQGYAQPPGTATSTVAQWTYTTQNYMYFIMFNGGTDWLLTIYYRPFVDASWQQIGVFAQTGVTCGPPLTINFTYSIQGGPNQTMVFTA